MKKILEIFKDDVRSLFKSKMAIIIILGIMIIPGIYAWLNIDSNWNPYDNTGNIPLAVVNQDEGTTILDNEVNIGDEIEKSLKENDDMKWIFTSEKKAIENVKSGKYYGAIIIPKNFSNQVTTIMSDGKIKKPQFKFYVNNKKNAIAPIIVNKAIGTIQNSVNNSFVDTLLYKTFDKVEDLDVITKTNQTTDDLVVKLNNSKVKIEELRIFLNNTNLAADSTSKSLLAIKEIIPDIGEIKDTASTSIADMENATKSFNDTYVSLNSDITRSLDDNESNMKEIMDILSKTDTSNVEDNFKTINDKLDKVEVNLTRLDNILISVNSVVDSNEIKSLENKVSERITKIENAKKLLTNTTEGIKNLQSIKAILLENSNSIKTIKDEYHDKVKKDIKTLYGTAADSVNDIKNVVSNLNISVGNVDTALVYAADALENGSKMIDNIDDLLVNFENDIDKIINEVSDAKNSDIYAGIVNLLKNKPEVIADFISNPVDTKQVDLYSIDAYGSKMTPFYSILACWVGCTLLTAIIKIETRKNKITKHAKHYQKFFGRFMLFGIIAMLQGLIIGLGDLFLQVQTVNTPLFLLTLMLSSLTFVLIIYSLAFTFGKVGQALSIVIMVMQVAGSGGTFPVELLPRFFKMFQPYMPFYPAMTAARETIGGFYKNDYITSILLLMCHMIIPLFFGLILSRHFVSTKEILSKELHETGVIE